MDLTIFEILPALTAILIFASTIYFISNFKLKESCYVMLLTILLISNVINYHESNIEAGLSLTILWIVFGIIELVSSSNAYKRFIMKRNKDIRDVFYSLGDGTYTANIKINYTKLCDCDAKDTLKTKSGVPVSENFSLRELYYQCDECGTIHKTTKVKVKEIREEC